MRLTTIEIGTSEDDYSLTLDQEQELVDLLGAWLDHIQFDRQAQQAISKATLSQGVEVEVDY